MSHHTSHITCNKSHKSPETALDPLCDTILEMSPPQYQHGPVINVICPVMFYYSPMVGLYLLICDICDVWCVMCDVTCDVPCHVYYSPMVMLGWWHFQNGVTQGVWGCFWWFVTFVTCDVWCVMWHVWHVMGPHTCHTYCTWLTVKISAKLEGNWLSKCYFCLCCVFF